VRALWAAVVTGAIAFASLIVVRSDAERLWHGLTTWPGVAAVVVSAIAGAGALALVFVRRFEPARAVSAVAVASIIAGWALAQRPQLLPGLTISEAAAGRATIIATLIGLAVGSLILVPSLGILFGMVLGGTFSAPPAPQPVSAGSAHAQPTDFSRQTAFCVVGLVAGALVLFVGDAAWSIALGAGLLLVAGACGFLVLARSLVAAA